MNWNNLELPDNPYYQDDAVVIYHADCLDILPQLYSQSVDLFISDPPYSIGISSSGKRTDYGDASLIKPFLKRLRDELFRLITINGAVYINTDWRTYPIWWDCFAPLEPPTNVIVWDYGWIKAGAYYRFTYELLMFWAKGNHILSDKSTPDVWRISPINFTIDKLHPAEKPIGLIDFILSKSKGDIILDPFLGSGTTALSAKKNGRKCLAVEINEKYCEIAANRCSQGVMELNNRED
jgi:site-specific DNA-methyltransferase (adenine-specific)